MRSLAWRGRTDVEMGRRSEKAIAAAVGQAARERAILMIDEVDSFLRDRDGAYHGWEVTQVNKMLTHIENFDGVRIASTNLMDGSTRPRCGASI